MSRLAVRTNSWAASGSTPTMRSMGGSFPRSALGSGERAGRRYKRGVPPAAGTRIANATRLPDGPVRSLTDGGTMDCEDGAPGARERHPQSTRTARGRKDRIGTKRPRRKIKTRRGQCKWCSDAELERRAEADGPIRLVIHPVQRLGDVEPQNDEAEQVHADRAPVAAQRCFDGESVVRV